MIHKLKKRTRNIVIGVGIAAVVGTLLFVFRGRLFAKPRILEPALAPAEAELPPNAEFIANIKIQKHPLSGDALLLLDPPYAPKGTFSLSPPTSVIIKNTERHDGTFKIKTFGGTATLELHASITTPFKAPDDSGELYILK